jgi:hypothetical protein
MVCDQDRSRDHAGTNDDGCWNAHGAEYAPFGMADKPFELPYSDWTTTYFPYRAATGGRGQDIFAGGSRAAVTVAARGNDYFLFEASYADFVINR